MGQHVAAGLTATSDAHGAWSMEFDTPKGKMVFRKEDHQSLQEQYVFRVKKDSKNEWDVLDLVRVVPAAAMPVPVKTKKP